MTRRSLFAVLALTFACQGDPETRTGNGLLEFGVVTHNGNRQVTTPQLSLYVAAPFYHWGYRGIALENDSTSLLPFTLPNIGLDQAPLFVRYRNSTAFWFNFATGASPASGVTNFDVANQHEILFFVRDPAEQAATMRTVDLLTDITLDITDFPGVWNGAWNPSLVPAAATMMYPPHAGWQTVTPLGNPTPTPVLATTIQSSDYWGSNTPQAPGAIPSSVNTISTTPSTDTSGSIKTVSVINHGLCSQTLPYLQGPSGGIALFPLIAKAIPAFLEGTACPTLWAKIGNMEIRWLSLGSFLDQTQPLEDAQRGGFFLNFNFQLNVAFNGGPNILARTSHTFRLFNGRPTVDSAWVDGESAGAGSDGVTASLVEAFTKPMSTPLSTSTTPTSLSEGVYQAADKFLVFPPAGLQAPCTQRSPGDDTIVATAPDPTDMNHCGAFISDFFNNSKNGLNLAVAAAKTNPVLSFFNVNLTSNEATELNETVLATNPATGTFRNFRCAQFPDSGSALGDPGAGRCQYVLPAKRLNTYPDGVEAVFLDEPKELDNPAYALWLRALYTLNVNGDATLYSGLCQAPTPQTPGTFGNRSFAVFPPPGSPNHDTQFSACLLTTDSCTCTCSGPNNDCPP